MSSGRPPGLRDMTETTTRLLSDSAAFSGFSVDDLDAARTFYEQVLGLRTTPVTEMGGLLRLNLAGGRDVLVYAKGSAHSPATYTVLNFPVPDVDAAVAELSAGDSTVRIFAVLTNEELVIALDTDRIVGNLMEPEGELHAQDT